MDDGTEYFGGLRVFANGGRPNELWMPWPRQVETRLGVEPECVTVVSDAEQEGPMAKVVAGAEIKKGECGEDDVTSANLNQMANTLEIRPPTDQDRRELVIMLRWLARLVQEIDESPASDCAASAPTDDPSR